MASQGFPSVQAGRLLFPKNMKINIEAYLGCESLVANRSSFCVQRRRRPLPATVVGTLEHPLTID